MGLVCTSFGSVTVAKSEVVTQARARNSQKSNFRSILSRVSPFCCGSGVTPASQSRFVRLSASVPLRSAVRWRGSTFRLTMQAFCVVSVLSWRCCRFTRHSNTLFRVKMLVCREDDITQRGAWMQHWKRLLFVPLNFFCFCCVLQRFTSVLMEQVSLMVCVRVCVCVRCLSSHAAVRKERVRCPSGFTSDWKPNGSDYGRGRLFFSVGLRGQSSVFCEGETGPGF